MSVDERRTHPLAIAERLTEIVEELAAWEPDATHAARPHIEQAGAFLELAVLNLRFPGRYSVSLREAIEEGGVRVIAEQMVGAREVKP